MITNKEINDRLAEMMEGEICPYIIGLLPTCANKSYRWNPCEHIEQAIACRDKILADSPGMTYVFNLWQDGHRTATFYPTPMIGGPPLTRYFQGADDESDAMAICLVCLAVKDGKKSNKGERNERQFF